MLDKKHFELNFLMALINAGLKIEAIDILCQKEYAFNANYKELIIKVERGYSFSITCDYEHSDYSITEVYMEVTAYKDEEVVASFNLDNLDNLDNFLKEQNK